MPVKIRHVVEVTCACHVDEGRPGKAYRISLDGEGGLLDLCAEGKRTYYDPLQRLMAKHRRVDQTDDVSDYTGAVTDAWPNARGVRNGKPPKPPKLAINGSVVGKRKNNGGARPNAGPVPRHRKMLCPLAPHSCNHPGCGSLGGIKSHMEAHHEGRSHVELAKMVTECGLCDPPTPKPTNTALGMHASREHRDVLGDDVHQGGWTLALISHVRRAGDPHGTLKAMDERALSVRSGKEGNHQLALEDSASADHDHEKDHQTEGVH